MPDWLFDGRLSVYAVLVVVALALLAVGLSQRRRGLLLAAAVPFLLILLYAMLDWSVETDREQIRRKLQGMTAAVTAGDLDRAFVDVSDAFHTHHGTGKQALRTAAEHYRRSGQVSSVRFWDIDIPPVSRDTRQAHVGFMARANPAMQTHLWCDAIFDYDPTHGWRLLTFRLYDPFRNNEEVHVPF